MQSISHYQVRGVPGEVKRSSFDGRIVDFWAPKSPTHLLIAHDGQNVFDPRTATKRFTWRMAQNAIRVFSKAGLTPPAIIGVFHSSTKSDPFGRYKDLTPKNPFLKGVKPLIKSELTIDQLHGDNYQALIAEKIVPAICEYLEIAPSFENTAMTTNTCRCHPITIAIAGRKIANIDPRQTIINGVLHLQRRNT